MCNNKDDNAGSSDCKSDIIKKLNAFLIWMSQFKSDAKQVGKVVNSLPLDLMPPPFHEYIEDTLKAAPTVEKKIKSITPLIIIKNIVSHPIYVARFFLSRLGLHINS